jgi:RNA polymerase sigma-70 factor (ECF subfamily)
MKFFPRSLIEMWAFRAAGGEPLRRLHRGEGILVMWIQQSRVLPFELPMAGDRALEFERLALPHAQSLLRYALHMDGTSKAAAEDLVQETLLAAWRNFNQFEPGTNCKAWLFRILTNLHYKQFRRRGVQREVALETLEAKFASAEKISASQEVRQAFARLSPEHQQVLQLAVIEGFGIREVAEILQLPQGTVMSRLSRARTALRGALLARASARTSAREGGL